jgi:hypothetical protein
VPDAPAKSGGLAALGRKVGPFPVWVYAAFAVAGWYWWTHYGPGAKTAAQPAGAAAADDSIGSNEITTALYADNSAWATAAINYLAGIGVPRKQATIEIDNYLRGLPNTAQGRGDVQLALNSVGPPPVNAPAPPAPGKPKPAPRPVLRDKPHPAPDKPVPLPRAARRSVAA